MRGRRQAITERVLYAFADLAILGGSVPRRNIASNCSLQVACHICRRFVVRVDLISTISRSDKPSGRVSIFFLSIALLLLNPEFRPQLSAMAAAQPLPPAMIATEADEAVVRDIEMATVAPDTAAVKLDDPFLVTFDQRFDAEK